MKPHDARYNSTAHGEHQLLSRTWLIDPSETQANAAVGKSNVGDKEPGCWYLD